MLSGCEAMNLHWTSSPVFGRIGARSVGSAVQNGSYATVTRSWNWQSLGVSEPQSNCWAQEQKRRRDLGLCFATLGGRELYQPFRPPPAPTPKGPASDATIEEQLEILKERRGLWFAYATIIPSLTRAGFAPGEIDEATGLNGHEQNTLVVGAQVRDSLVANGFDNDLLSWFDIGGEDRLYELRILSAPERKAAAQFVVERNLDAKLCRDLAKSIKDFPRRKKMEGFSKFSTAPGDALAFALYRQSKESPSEAEFFLNQALEFAVTDRAKSKILSALGLGEVDATDDPSFPKLKVAVVRLSGESPVVLPVADYSAKSLKDAPSHAAITEGPLSGKFNVTRTETVWKSWIAIPRWQDAISAVFPVAVIVPDGTLLPQNTGIELTTNPILLVVDKGDTTPGIDNFSLVASPDGGLTLQEGSRIAKSNTVLGKVLIAVKPPLPQDPSIDPDWD